MLPLTSRIATCVHEHLTKRNVYARFTCPGGYAILMTIVWKKYRYSYRKYRIGRADIAMEKIG